MPDLFQLSAEHRPLLGKAATRRLRRLHQKVPAVVYGAGKQPLSVMISHNLLTKALEHEAFYSHILTLTVEDHSEKVVLKALQRHPSKPVILHADFFRISETEKLTMSVPVHFLNEETAHGVKVQGGLISHMLTEIEVRCLPSHLPEYIELDLTHLKLDETIHLSDIRFPEGVEAVGLIHQEDLPVVKIHKPTVSAEPEEAPSVSPAEVPVIEKAEKNT